MSWTRRLVVGAVGALLLAGGVAPAHSQEPPEIGFEPAVLYPAATVSSCFGAGLADVADFDGDGRPDLVVADVTPGGPNVLLNHGDGTFAPPRRLGLPTDTCTVATGDFDGDGHVDIVAVSYLATALTVLLGNGDGTFAARLPCVAGLTLQQIAVADFDSDGRLDVAVPGLPGPVRVLRGLGDGTFRSCGQLAIGLFAPAIAAGDLNADGHADVVVSTEFSPLSVLLGRGDGTFAPGIGYRATEGDTVRYIAIGDVDGDGVVDLATANSQEKNIGLLIGNGDGTFRAHHCCAAPAGRSGFDPVPGVAIADFNGDGLADLAQTFSASGLVAIHAGTDGGSFRAEGEYRVSHVPEPVFAADFDGDGRTDLAVPGNLPDGGLSTVVAVLRNA
ncbi:MAG: FG-GAP repeat domain-containing protein [Acidimicrobiales bacterium]